MVAILNLGLALNFYANFPYVGATLACQRKVVLPSRYDLERTPVHSYA